jgi:K+-sensing histidine kinase KdpD
VCASLELQYETGGIHNNIEAISLDNAEAKNGSSSLGLGLYICKQIVAAHGGIIDVRSSVNEGTTFIVRLPNA